MKTLPYQVTIAEFTIQYNEGNLDYLTQCVVTDGTDETVHYDKGHHLVTGEGLISIIGGFDEWDFESSPITIKDIVMPSIDMIIKESGPLHDNPDYTSEGIIK